MRTSCHSPDRIKVMFDDDAAVGDGGLVLPMLLADRLGLRELVDKNLKLGDAPGRANVGLKATALVASLLAGGDSIDDADALRAGQCPAVVGQWIPAPSTLGTFLRSISGGHARQLDAVSRVLLVRAFQAGAGPGDAPFTLDLDSSICETYGLAKQGGAKFTCTHVRGYHPLLAVMAGTGDVVHARLRGGNANSGRGAASFLVETFARVRAAGATGQMTLRADSGFYSHKVVDACRAGGVRSSITVRLNKGLRRLIDAIPEEE